jgi:manganese/zinc/iron transport system permease protein
MLSETTVGAFTEVGAILVVALVIVPAATAYLLTDQLAVGLVLSIAIGAAAAYLGYHLAVAPDASISGSMVTMTAVLFGLAPLISPSQGTIARSLRRARQRRRFATELLVVHLFRHEGSADKGTESAVARLGVELRWSEEPADAAVERALRTGLVTRTIGNLTLTDSGRAVALSVLAR